MLRPPCARAPGAQLPEPGPRGGGAGSRQPEGPGPASPRSGGSRTPGSRALPPGFYPCALGVGRGAGSRVPPLRTLPAAGTSSEAEGGSGLGAWRGARGAGRGHSAANRSGGRRPLRGPAAACLPPLALPRRGRGGGLRGGRAWGASAEDALTHSHRLRPFVQSRIRWWCAGGRLGGHAQSERERLHP